MQNMLQNAWQTVTLNRKNTIIFMGVISLLLVVVMDLCLMLGGKDPLKGRWSLDGVTVYEFRDNGSGALVLDTGEYPFRYRTEGDRLTIDFETDSATDREYTYVIQDKTLVLTFGQQRYEMTRE